MWNKGEEEECESVRERSGSSQRREAAHTNHRELSQEPLAHTGGAQAGQQAVPGTRQKEQAVRGIRLFEHRLSERTLRENRQAEVPGSQRKQAVREQTACHKLSPLSQRKQAVRKQKMAERQDCETAGCQPEGNQRRGS